MSSLATQPNEVLLEATGIAKSFPGVRALDGVNLTVQRGRLNALLGENGAGKSTMMNILAGVFPPDAGTVTMEGKPVSFKNTREAQAAGIAIIFQELNLVPELSIAENIFIGRESLNRFGLVDFARMNADTAALLKELELDVDPFERTDREAMGYTKWRAEHAYAILPFVGYVGQHLQTYVAYPPRQKAGTFGLDEVLRKLQEGGEK